MTPKSPVHARMIEIISRIAQKATRNGESGARSWPPLWQLPFIESWRSVGEDYAGQALSFLLIDDHVSSGKLVPIEPDLSADQRPLSSVTIVMPPPGVSPGPNWHDAKHELAPLETWLLVSIDHQLRVGFRRDHARRPMAGRSDGWILVPNDALLGPVSHWCYPHDGPAGVRPLRQGEVIGTGLVRTGNDAGGDDGGCHIHGESIHK